MDSSWLNVIVFIAGFLLGAGVSACLVFFLQRKSHSSVTHALKESTLQNQSLLESFSNQLSSKLHEASLETLSKSTDSMLRLASHQLHGDRELITENLKNNKEELQRHLDHVNSQLLKVTDLINSAEKEKGIQMSKISSLITTANQQTADLVETTSNLKSILASSQTRGQLGERIAEDILRLAGFIENINYTKQKALSNGMRPDFTFLLPNDLTLNMDVKFPIQNYTKFMESKSKQEKEKACRAFLYDVRACYKELADRAYYDLKESVDCVVLLIPHEQVFAFIMQEDPGLIDFGLKHKIITCSPMTLFAVLAVVRKAIDHFTIEKTSQEILEQIVSFRKQWDMYNTKFQMVGKRIQDLQNEYDTLSNTRTRLLDKQIEKLERIKQNASIH